MTTKKGRSLFISFIASLLLLISQSLAYGELSNMLYFLAGEPTPKSDSAFSSILYTAKEGDQKLQLVRKITDIGS
jgi:hypothetical protein